MPILSLSLFELVPILLNLIKNCYDLRTNKTVPMKLWTLKPYAYDYEHLPMTMNTAYDYGHCL